MKYKCKLYTVNISKTSTNQNPESISATLLKTDWCLPSIRSKPTKNILLILLHLTHALILAAIILAHASCQSYGYYIIMIFITAGNQRHVE